MQSLNDSACVFVRSPALLNSSPDTICLSDVCRFRRVRHSADGSWMRE